MCTHTHTHTHTPTHTHTHIHCLTHWWKTYLQYEEDKQLTVASAVVSSVWEWTDAQPIGTVPVVVANVAVVEATTLKLCKNMQRTPRVPHDIALDTAQAVYVMQYIKTLMSLHEYDTSCVLFSLQHHNCTGCASQTWPHNV